MFHRPSSIGGDSNAMSMTSRPRSLLPSAHHHLQHSNNENSSNSTTKVLGASNTTTTTTTPAKSRPRRAFGDISNKKAPNGFGGGGGGGKDQQGNSSSSSSNHKGSSSSLVRKPSANRSSSNAFTPRSSNKQQQQFQSRIPKTAGGSSKKQLPLQPKQQQQQQTLSKRSHPWSKQSISRSSTPSSRQVDFILPTTSRIEPRVKPQPPKATSTVDTLPTPQQLETAEPVDDVELPAGRLWKEQLELEDDDDDDCASTSSLVGGHPQGRTMWDDWKDTMHQQWKEQRLELELADERDVQAQLDRVVQADEQGLESLLDTIDALPLLSLDDDDDDDDGIGRMIQKNVEQQLLALDEDDDWSAPASSIDGTLGMMTFEL